VLAKVSEVHDFIEPIINRERELIHPLFAAMGPNENSLPEVGHLY
jgi:hypothetical protein